MERKTHVRHRIFRLPQSREYKDLATATSYGVEKPKYGISIATSVSSPLIPSNRYDVHRYFDHYGI
jgi:hypothetical protein